MTIIAISKLNLRITERFYTRCLIFILLTIPIVSAADSTVSNESNTNPYVEVFSDLVQEYCVKFRYKPEKLQARLEADGFKRNTEFEATFEKDIESISYAITIDRNFCTTDVLLKHKNKILFSADQLNEALTSLLKLTTTKSKTGYDPDVSDSKILQKKYIDDRGEKYSLFFPLENQHNEYMTFDVHWVNQ